MFGLKCKNMRKTNNKILIEKWKPVMGYEKNYLVSNTGRVLNRVRNTIVKGSINKRRGGYVYINLQIKRKNRINKSLHRLVAENWIDNPYKFNIVNHLDGIKTNNTVSNLEWCTAKRNTQHAIELGLLKHKYGDELKTKLSERDVILIRRLFKVRPDLLHKQIANVWGVGNSTITHVLLNTRRKKFHE